MIIATAGHVDHGKTLLVNALTGIETDRLEEEKERGLTIDLGFAYIDDELGGRLGFIDVPGHIKFINNMLAGVGAIDYALLVIAADDGPMPQTLEHLAILDQLDIQNGAVALTKIDRVEAPRLEQVTDEISALLSNTSLAGLSIYPVSSITGEGIDDLKTTLCLVASELDSRSVSGYFRLAIDRCFGVKGSGLVVTGSVFSGKINEKDELYLAPQGEVVRARNIHTQDQTAASAQAGDRCAINIASNNLKRENISRGNWLTNNPHHRATDRFDISVKVLPSEEKALHHWTPVHVHTAANHITGRAAILGSGSLKPGETGLAQIVTSEPVNVCFGDRIILRDQGASRTIAGGKVIDAFSPKRGRNTQARKEMLEKLADLNARQALRVLVSHAPLGLDRHHGGTSLNLRPEEIEELLSPDQSTASTQEQPSSKVHQLGDTLITSSNLKKLERTVIDTFDQWHEQNKTEKGLPLNQVKSMLPRGCAISELIISGLVETGQMIKSGNLYQRPGVTAQLSPETRLIWERIEPLLLENKTRPPVPHDLAATLDLPPKRLEKILAECIQSGLVLRPIPNRYFLPAGLDELRELLPAAANGDDFTVKEFRDVSGIGRNLCIEILEYFDRQGITQRLGDKRKIK